MKDKFYVSTPLYYVNGELHIGGAYTTIAADILARYHRAYGKDVFFLTGSDEHGQKILREAEKNNVSPKEFADNIVGKFHELWSSLDITHDHFIRTTDPSHEEAVKALFKRLIEQGDVYLGSYNGYYCTPCETYLKPSECDCCPQCGRKPELIAEENYFFRLSKFQERLLKHIDENPNFILPLYRRNEVRNRVAEGMDDLSISRSTLSWGIPFPGDEKHVIYVWVEALCNYVTALGFPDETNKLKDYWPANVHLMAKDILWFHAVIWPCMLMALDYPLPETIFAHGWWTINSEKISKSKGNIIYPRDVTEKYGRDALRYYLFREIPFGRDGDFTLGSLDKRYQNELGNDLGNLIMRTVSMIGKYFDGIVPEPHKLDEASLSLKAKLEKLPQKAAERFKAFELTDAIDDIWAVVRDTNRYVEHSAPWKLAKQGETEKLSTVLYVLAEACRELLLHLYPFLPDTAAAGIPQFGVEWDPTDLANQTKWGGLKPGSVVTKGAALFPRLEDSKR